MTMLKNGILYTLLGPYLLTNAPVESLAIFHIPQQVQFHKYSCEKEGAYSSQMAVNRAREKNTF